MAQNTVKCQNCNSDIIPRLWRYEENIFTYLKTQHQCPICGTVMYETGGEIRTEIKIAALIFCFAFSMTSFYGGHFLQGVALLVLFIAVSILGFPTQSGRFLKKVLKSKNT